MKRKTRVAVPTNSQTEPKGHHDPSLGIRKATTTTPNNNKERRNLNSVILLGFFPYFFLVTNVVPHFRVSRYTSNDLTWTRTNNKTWVYNSTSTIQ